MELKIFLIAFYGISKRKHGLFLRILVMTTFFTHSSCGTKRN